MYEKFKRKLLEEMEMRRDMIVLSLSRPSLEPIFEVSSYDDKLYRKILDEFDRIAVRNCEDLLYQLCTNHKIRADKEVKAIRENKETRFDLMMEINGQESYIELKTSPLSYNESAFRKFTELVRYCNQPVYLVYLLKENQASRNAVERQFCAVPEGVNAPNLKIDYFEHFLSEQFGSKELDSFKNAMITYKDEMHKAIGYQITEIFNDYNLGQLKKVLEKELHDFPYDCVKRAMALSPDSNKDLNSDDYAKIKNMYLKQERYRFLLGSKDFAKSFLTSEWLYKKYSSLPEMDNTFIIAGYLKSIEQLLWEIVCIVGQGREISLKGGKDTKLIQEDNLETINATLGNLNRFLTDYKNDDLYREALGERTHFVMKYLGSQLGAWIKTDRNGYFHKHNLNENQIKTIREETIFLYMLILGSLSLTEGKFKAWQD